MNHEYVEYSQLNPELRELHVDRDDIKRLLGEASVRLCVASQEYNDVVLQLIEISGYINEAETY